MIKACSYSLNLVIAKSISLLVMGLDQKFLTLAGLANFFYCSSWSAFSGLGKFTHKIFNFFLSGQKISLGWIKKYLGQSQVGPLITVEQKF